MTYTYVVLPVSMKTYNEIREKLLVAGYDHAFHDDGYEEVMDMHGIAIGLDPQERQ